MFRLVRQAVLVVAPRKDFRVVHMSVQGNHIHLICEAASAPALASGLKGFKTSLARRINGATERHGAVFADRYHVESPSSVRHVRNAICYVLNNWRKHQDDRDAVSWIDPFSTACHFDGWVERDRLLREGWKRGAPISVWERPGART
jgi:putative transposase